MKQADFSAKRHDIKLENTDIVNNIKETSLSHLTLEQQSDIEALIQEFKSLLSNVPKKTTKIKHDIEFLSSCQKTCKQHPYHCLQSRTCKTSCS